MHFGAYDAFRLVIDHTKPSVELQSLLRAIDVNNNGIIEPFEVATNLEGFSVELENLVLSANNRNVFDNSNKSHGIIAFASILVQIEMYDYEKFRSKLDVLFVSQARNNF